MYILTRAIPPCNPPFHLFPLLNDNPHSTCFPLLNDNPRNAFCPTSVTSLRLGTLYILFSFIHFIFRPCAKSLAQGLEREAREAKLTKRTKRRKKGSSNLNADKHDDIRKSKVIDPMSSNEMGRCLRLMERMVNHNLEHEIYTDFKYWEDASDQYRDGSGSVLPLWRFASESTRSKHVTCLRWHPKFADLFAVSYGSYDFMRQGSGLIYCYSLKVSNRLFFATWLLSVPLLICATVFALPASSHSYMCHFEAMTPCLCRNFRTRLAQSKLSTCRQA